METSGNKLSKSTSILLLCLFMFYVTYQVIHRGNTSHSNLRVGVLNKSTSVNMEKAYVKRNCSEIHQNKSYITFYAHGCRLGNVLFSFASLYGIAHRNHMIPIIVLQRATHRATKHMFRQVQQIKFDIPVYDFKCFSKCTHVKHIEQHGRIYDNNTENLNVLLKNKTSKCTLVQLFGFWQSWKYFHNVTDKLLQHLHFNAEAATQAGESLLKVRQIRINQQILQQKELSCAEGRNYKSIIQRMKGIFLYFFQRPLCPEVKVIGIHIRRGDMVWKLTVAEGYIAPKASYFFHAMNYFKNKVYPNNILQFVVCSNDMKWSKEHLTQDNVVFAEGNSVAADLYLLSQCDGLIASFGTFSFWAAYLNRGKVIYYKDWIKPNSHLSRVVKIEDHYLPEWIPLS